MPPDTTRVVSLGQKHLFSPLACSHVSLPVVWHAVIEQRKSIIKEKEKVHNWREEKFGGRGVGV